MVHRPAAQAVAQAYYALCKSVNSPRSLGMWLRYKYREHADLARVGLDPNDYLHADDFRNDYLVVEFLSKYKGLDTGIDTKAVALEGFTANENVCALTNRRLVSDANGINRWSAVMATAARKILRLIGHRPSWKVLELCGWGPGATYSLKGEQANLVNKLREEQISITLQALPYLRAVLAFDVHWLKSRGINAVGPASPLDKEFRVVLGGRLLTVPKNAKTDRVICAEPTGNVFLQKGAGAFIRKRLLRVGVDLNDQKINQELARLAEALGLATIDLKAASDTICKELVRELVPPAWYVFLDALRSPFVEVEGKWIRLEKFSSMGNGFTFELESLIFWALTQSLCELRDYQGKVSVYGDDIVAPTECVPELQGLFAFAGFTINKEKTHYASRFRESCGKHYFAGADVTPLYQKEVPETDVESVTLANRLLYHALDRGGSVVLDRTIHNAWDVIQRYTLSNFARVPTGPVVTSSDVSMDAHLMLPDSIPVFDRLGRGVKCIGFSFKSKKLVAKEGLEGEPLGSEHDALYAYWLRFTPPDPFEGRVAVRRRGRYRTRVRYYRETSVTAWA
ncbi:RNA-directed RNA polymerase [ssRNA phage SRR6960551_9]|uniref:RNA-directed RNA polymerase n=1 Tax=ssRNA phage SRR6960551_9 TaxID=2786560 RepID=A0A8S5KZ78_9VIRU|nr:RNA-directed RNA polymerase [ssRNA phage SRR6960551_9]DAD51030.1 TPA_asm: RNA-directed RNA polymerase [ssRNA phage SRR6960551_9]